MSMQEISQNTCDNSRQGFTLIELLLVIGIIAVLAGIVITSVNPKHQLGGARNAQRWSDVTTILDGFAQFALDNGGEFDPATVDGNPLESACAIPVAPTAARKVCKLTTPHGTDAGECGDTGNECVFTGHLSGAYLVDIVPDPADDEATAVEQLRVDYTVQQTAAGRLTVTAENAEQGINITKTR